MIQEKNEEDKIKERDGILEEIDFKIVKILVEPDSYMLGFVVEIGYVAIDCIRVYKIGDLYKFEFPHGILDPWHHPLPCVYITQTKIWHAITAKLVETINENEWMGKYVDG